MQTSADEFLTLNALAETLGVSKATLYTWCRTRRLPSIRVGTRTYFHVPAVAGWLKGLEKMPRSGRILRAPHHRRGAGVGRIPEKGHSGHLGNDLLEQLQLLPTNSGARGARGIPDIRA